MKSLLQAVLISTYDLGHQPFGLASPAAWLRREGMAVACLDLAVQPLDEAAIRAADLIAFFLPMHTATRLAVPAVHRVRRLNPDAHLCFYGLYAALNEAYLRALGGDSILSGEYEAGLVAVARRLRTPAGGVHHEPQPEPVVSLARQRFLVPDRGGLPPLKRYAGLQAGDGQPRRVGYTQASRGCKHHCRHCPIVPVYRGQFRVVAAEIVLEDIRQQVASGAEHITFGDPDFLNGPGHSLPLVETLHAEFPDLTYDVTIKVEHLLQHARHLDTLRRTGCLFVTSAVESLDDRVLEILDKGHTRTDFEQAVRLCRQAGLILQPTFVAFHPWITVSGYQDLLETIARLDLVEQVAPVQLAIRLLLPAGSLLLEHSEVQPLIEPFDPQKLVYPWRHPDPAVDELQRQVETLVRSAAAGGEARTAIFDQAWQLAGRAPGAKACTLGQATAWPRRDPIPYLTEPWYC